MSTDHDSTPRPVRWWRPWLAAAIATAVIVGIGSFFVYSRDQIPASMDMGGDGAHLPQVTGYYDGEPIAFVHTEASDAEVGGMLTDMMGGSPVITVPDLAEVPEAALGPVFVFTSGVEPDGATGPFGFQPDVFDSVPGDDAYTPLRRVLLVEWNPDATARVLRSAAEVTAAEQDGEVQVTDPGVVVNMPVVAWPGGSR